MVTTVVQLNAEKREGVGKGAARALRREGKIPAIIYGGTKGEVSIATDFRELNIEYQKGHFSSKVVELDVAGEKIRTLPRDIQIHPVTDDVLHVDFQRITKDQKVRVMVPVVLKDADKSPGLKRGGVLNIVRRDVELSCDIDSIPSRLVINLESLQIGDSVHVSAVDLPEGATPTITERDFTIATIVGRGAAKAEAKAEDEAAEEGDEDATEDQE